MEGSNALVSILCFHIIVLQSCVGVDSLLEPDFVSNWYDMIAQAGTDTTFLTIAHGLGETPLLVDVQVMVTSGDNKGYIFPGSGCRARDDDEPEGYGGIIYIYNDVYIKMSSPIKANHFLGRCVYTGKSPYWEGPYNTDSYTAKVRARAWKISTLPPANFIKTGIFISAGGLGSQNYFEIVHGLGYDYPALVISRVRFPSYLETYPNYYSDSVENDIPDITNKGASMGMYDKTSTQNAFVVYGFDNTTIRIWAPTAGTDYIFAGTDGWNFDTVKNGTLELYAWNDSSLPPNLTATLKLGKKRSSDGLQQTAHFTNHSGYFVTAWVQATSGVNAGFRFVGNGNLAYDEVKTADGCSYGGLLYAYDNHSIRFWQPGPGNGTSNGALICIANGMGGGVNVQASTEGVAVYYSWDLDTNECSLNIDNCDNNAVCTNTPGSFICTCKTGYIGNGVTCSDCPSPLAPDNGYFVIDNEKMEVNDSVTFLCYPGYKLNGKTNTMCNPNGTWNGIQPTCIVQNCSNPSPPDNGNYRTTTLQVNSTALLSCNPGYNLSGNGTIKCTENGTWTYTSVECLPLECPKLQAPDNGSLVLSNYIFYESKGSFSCYPGYNLIGAKETECTSFGNWTNPKPSCRPIDCGNWKNVSPYSCNVSYSPDSLYNSTAICSCKYGYHFYNSTKKSIAARCGLNGTWDKQSPPLCVAIECPLINDSLSKDVYYSNFNHFVDTKAIFSCYNSESQIIGHEMVTCLTSGKWSGSSPKCEKIDKTVPPCQKEGIWNETLPGAIISKPCKAGYQGESSRKCTKEGKWKLPVDNCVRAAIAKLDNEVEAIKDNPSEQAVTNVLQNLDKLTNTTKSSKSQNDITSGELEKVTSILETIVDISNKSAVTENQAESFLKTTSNLLNTDNAQSWQAISQKNDDSASDQQPSSGASKILDVVCRYSDAVVSLLKNSKNDSKTIEASNLVMHVAKVKTGTDVSFPKSGDKVNYKSSFHLPKESLKDLKHISSVLYKNLTGILSSKTTSDGNESKHQINSEVVAVKIPNWTKNKDAFKLNLSFTHFQDKYSSLNCSFWNETRNAWDGDGCTLKSSSKSSTTCECNHLTNFAILMSPWVEENVDTKALDIISTVGCSISLIALVITIVFHIALWRFLDKYYLTALLNKTFMTIVYLILICLLLFNVIRYCFKYIKSERVVILMNLSIALVISYAIFLGGVDRTENKDVCTSVAVLLQYIYLVVFFLMLAEGIEISVSVLYVFTTASRLKWLLPAAWLIPAVIVGISLGATQLEGYGNEQFCWLSVEGGLIWAFVAPAFIIIIVNFVLLVLVLRAAFGARTLAEKSKAERTKAGVKCLCVLLPVMGCTWVIGIFYVNKDMGWIQYVFAVCNGLQGLVIFIFHCALNKQIRMAIERRKRKYASSLLSSASSTKKFTMPRVSTSSISDRRDSMSNSFSRDDVSFKSRRDSERRNFPEENYDMIDYKMMSTNSLHSSLMQKNL